MRFSTPAVQLATDESGAVTGVIAKDADGYFKANASKGVIMATGGYDLYPRDVCRHDASRRLRIFQLVESVVGNHGRRPHDGPCHRRPDGPHPASGDELPLGHSRLFRRLPHLERRVLRHPRRTAAAGVSCAKTHPSRWCPTPRTPSPPTGKNCWYIFDDTMYDRDGRRPTTNTRRRAGSSKRRAPEELAAGCGHRCRGA